MVGALQTKEMISALCEHLGKNVCSLKRGLQMDTCNKKMKMAAFASDSEKLIMPPRSSFGRYLQ